MWLDGRQFGCISGDEEKHASQIRATVPANLRVKEREAVTDVTSGCQFPPRGR